MSQFPQFCVGSFFKFPRLSKKGLWYTHLIILFHFSCFTTKGNVGIYEFQNECGLGKTNEKLS